MEMCGDVHSAAVSAGVIGRLPGSEAVDSEDRYEAVLLDVVVYT